MYPPPPARFNKSQFVPATPPLLLSVRDPSFQRYVPLVEKLTLPPIVILAHGQTVAPGVKNVAAPAVVPTVREPLAIVPLPPKVPAEAITVVPLR